MGFFNKKKQAYVSPVTEAREKVTTAVTAFSTLSADLNDAAATLAAEASGNRNLANKLVSEADALENESAQSAKIANKLADFLA